MKVIRSISSVLITLLLLMSSIVILVPQISADTTSMDKTLYFTPYDPLEGSILYSDFGNPLLSEAAPTGSNSSAWPPRLLDREGKILPDLQTDEWIAWVELWVMYQFADQLLGEFGEFAGEDSDLIKSFFDMYNPFRISQDFIYTDNSTMEIIDDITFNLFIKSKSKLISKDGVKVGVSKQTLLFPQELATTNITVPFTILPNQIKSYPVELDISDVNIVLEQDDSLTFFVEILPSSRVLGRVLTRMSERGFEDRIMNILSGVADFLSNRRLERLKNLGDTIHEFMNLSEMFSQEGVNLSLSDIAELTDGFRTTQFFFGSASHSSNIQFMMEPSENQEITKKKYYLHANQLLDTTKPTNVEPESQQLTTNSLQWTADGLTRNRVLLDAKAVFYLDYRYLIPLNPLSITATLLDQGDEIVSTSLELDRTTLLDLLNADPTKITLSFPIPDSFELWHDHDIGFSVELASNTSLGFRKVHLVYDSTNASSYVSLIFKETDNIIVSVQADPSDGLIVPGDSVHYQLDVTSKYDDDLTAEVILQNKAGLWETISIPSSQSITAQGTQVIDVYVNSTDIRSEAYGNSVDALIQVSGKTGIDHHLSTVQVTQDAIEYAIDIIEYPESIEIQRGGNVSFDIKMVNNNTGAIDDVDSYSVDIDSEQDWDLEYPSTLSDVKKGKTKTFTVTVYVPDDTREDNDTLEITLQSQKNPDTTQTITVIVEVTSGSILDIMYEWFEDASHQLGFNDVFGEYAATGFAVIILLVVFFIIILLALLLTNKVLILDCPTAVKEINTYNLATYEITLRNPTRKLRSYTINTMLKDAEQQPWNVQSVEHDIEIPAKQSRTIEITVEPPRAADTDAWALSEVQIQVVGKHRQETLELMTLIVTGEPTVALAKVSHFPRRFTAGEKILTTCRVENKHLGETQRVDVTLYINGEQKNKVEDITIPVRGYAEVTLPWIAVSGSNDVYIKVTQRV